jgi:hypothetical protein
MTHLHDLHVICVVMGATLAWVMEERADQGFI